MSDQPYTYITLTMPADESPRVGVSFHTSALWVRSGVLPSAVTGNDHRVG